MNRIAILGLSAILCFAFAGTTGRQAAGSPATGASMQAAPQPLVFDLDFKGGTAADFVAAIRKATRDTANIVIMPDAGKVVMPAVQLKSVGVEGALSLLQDRTAQVGTQVLQLRLVDYPGRAPLGEQAVYSVVADGVTQPTQIKVYSVADLLSGDLSSDDLMTAIETAMDLLSDSHAPAEVRFHPETGILIVRGDPDQTEAVKDVIGQLFDGVQRKRRESRQQDDYHNAQNEARKQADRANALEAQLNDARSAAAELEARFALTQQELERVRDQLTATEQAKTDCESRLRVLQIEIAKLKGDKDAGRDGSQ